MKWLGKHIVGLTAYFRKDVYIDDSLRMYNDVIDGNPVFTIGSGSNDRLMVQSVYAAGTKKLSYMNIKTYTTDSTAHAGQFVFSVDESNIMGINDAGIKLWAGKGLYIDANAIITDNPAGTATLSNIDDLDATTIATFNAHLTAGDITGVTITTDSGEESSIEIVSGNAAFSILGSNGVGVTNSGTEITVTAVPGEIDHDSLNNYADAEHFTQPNITTVGTIGTGVWNGTPITTAYIGDDQITEDKLANTLLAEIDANTAKATNVTTNLTATTHASQITINSSDGTNVVVAEASGSIAGVMTVAHHDKLDGIETSATADQTRADIEGLEITTVGTVSNGTWNGTKISSVYANTGGRRYGNILKILPQDFMVNHDVLTEPLTFKDGGNSGVAVSNTASEMIAFVAIPEGMKATALDIHATNNKTVKIFEIEIDDSFDFDSATANETGSANTQITIDPAISATALNYLAIIYVATSTTNRIWGGALTIAPQ